MNIFGLEIGFKKKASAYGVVANAENRRSIWNVNISFESLYALYSKNVDVRACIREIYQTVGAGGYVFKENGEVVEDEKAQEAKFVLNSQGSWDKTKKRILRDLMVTGNTYIHKIPNIQGNMIVGLQVIDPRTMSIVADEYGDVSYYIQRVGSNTVRFEPEEIIHIIDESSPTNEIFGFSRLETAFWESQTDLSAMTSNYHFFENDAKPGTFFVLEAGMSIEEQTKANDFIKEQFGGAKNRNKSGAISGVKDIITSHITQKDMEFLAGRSFSTDKVCESFGVPKFLIGLTATVNNNNGVELTKNTYFSTYQPLEETLEEELTRKLFMPLFGYEFKFNVQDFQKDENDKKALDEYKNGVLTLQMYKERTGQKIFPEDEKNPLFDKHIFVGQNISVANQLEKMNNDGNSDFE